VSAAASTAALSAAVPPAAASAASCLLPLPTAYAVANTRRHFSSYIADRLARLHADADASPHDALKQQRYLKALLSVQPAGVLARVQSGQYANNNAIQQICDDARRAMRAGTDTPHTHYAQPQATPAQPFGASAASSSPGGATLLPAGLGSASNPLIVSDAPYSRIPWWESAVHATGRAAGVLAALALLYWAWDKMGKPNLLSAMGDMNSKKDFLTRTMSNVRFADVKGCDEAKAELQEVVEYLKNPGKFERLGGRMTKGLLLTGPPGTGQRVRQ
jgi:ATP-dependent metalloprotease